MKFYVFAEDTDSIYGSIKNAKIATDNYEEALEYFNEINKNYKYSNSYIIADFEYKHSSFVLESLENLKNDIIVPFLIIREFHYNKHNEYTIECNATDSTGRINNDLTIRKDSIIIESTGFAQEFNNNHVALEKFLYFVNNGIPVTMNLMFVSNKQEDGKLVETSYKRKIASSIEVLRDKPVPLKKIYITKNQKFNKYEFPKYSIYNFTFVSSNEMINI